KLSAKGRPSEVAWWIGRARKCTPPIKDVEQFRRTWKAWWRSLNPEWRRRDGEDSEMSREGGREWTELLVSGTNGMRTVLFCLKWW
ncbi:hypothetical protein FB451DRAFT_1012407, partial [Mycena latifolia]